MADTATQHECLLDRLTPEERAAMQDTLARVAAALPRS